MGDRKCSQCIALILADPKNDTKRRRRCRKVAKRGKNSLFCNSHQGWIGPVAKEERFAPAAGETKRETPPKTGGHKEETADWELINQLIETMTLQYQGNEEVLLRIEKIAKALKD